ncbi:hypothetical protein DN068_09340 [Taibaiella soli]|uniref:ComEC/Rec2-related protein domain-containing protein n=1 Tax=Taibaiella soli TaxID=1649169 RepID=A0A2W2BAY5_9BACT|nr:hypothetical protein DN068_09340 [Taibaiella soli]
MRHKKYTALKYLLAIIPIWIYVLMAGGAPSAVRSAVMFSMLTVGIVLQRDHNPLNTLFAAAFILLVIKPTWLFSVGFQLSFLAVLSLIVFYSPLCKLIQPGNKILRWLWNACAASIAAELLVAPLVLYYFHSFPAMFLIANIVASICMSVLLIAGIALIAVCWSTTFATLIASCCSLITLIFNKIIFALQAWSPNSFNRFQFSATEISLFYFIIICCSVWIFHQKRKMLLVAMSFGCTFTALLILDKWQSLHQHLLIVYNTGKAQNAELIVGRSFSTLLKTDTLKENFAVRNAHTGFHLTRQKAISSDAFFIGNKKVLVLKTSPESGEPFPVDILIIGKPLKKTDFLDAYTIFKPGQIVLPSGQPKQLTTAWKDSCSAHHIILHDAAEHGWYYSQ